MKSVFALFKKYDDLQSALDEMLQYHFDPSQMNVIVQEATAKIATKSAGPGSLKSGKESEHVSHVLDHLLAGEQPVALPDAGRVYAAGELASILVKDIDTPMSVEDTLEDALVSLHLPVQTSKAYVEGIKRGGLLFWIRTNDEQSATVSFILDRHNGTFVTGNLPTAMVR